MNQSEQHRHCIVFDAVSFVEQEKNGKRESSAVLFGFWGGFASVSGYLIGQAKPHVFDAIADNACHGSGTGFGEVGEIRTAVGGRTHVVVVDGVVIETVEIVHHRLIEVEVGDIVLGSQLCAGGIDIAIAGGERLALVLDREGR